jgi:flagellar hook-length control protein FliK
MDPTPPSTQVVASTLAARPSAPVAQVEGSLRWMLKGGIQEAQLQLHPDSLGQVTIHLKVVGSEVHARLWITEPGSVQAVQEGRPHLELALKEQGLQLGSFDLQQGHRPFQEPSTTPTFREPATPEALAARQEAPAALPTAILNPHHVELYA